ncbi:MAG: H4MPT-linked C1 transfer pathway protein [Methanomicrobiales archaeon]|nr:H4MPT-linked C1 transfer pathway protein [Methanomicrobiales archaeon]
MIGIDVGGANTKVVDGTIVTIRYAPLWEGAALAATLRELVQGKNLQDAAVVMSGELADCFTCKSEGIAHIVHAVQKVIPSARFYGTDARFHRAPVPELAAGNWLASADYLKDLYPNAVLVDMGSTTTDVIPLRRFSWLRGLTDYDRLQKGYLTYTGLLRTPVAALLPRVTIAGKEMGTSPEYFATSADVHLLLGHISPAEYTCSTPDHRGTTQDDARRRLARVVCADLEEIGPESVQEIADQFWEIQRRTILTTIQSVAKESGAREVITAGTGSALVAGISGGLDLRDVLGDVVDALPAYAVKEVAQRTGSS